MHAFTVTNPPKWDPHTPILNTCYLCKYYSISRIDINATFLVIPSQFFNKSSCISLSYVPLLHITANSIKYLILFYIIYWFLPMDFTLTKDYFLFIHLTTYLQCLSKFLIHSKYTELTPYIVYLILYYIPTCLLHQARMPSIHMSTARKGKRKARKLFEWNIHRIFYFYNVQCDIQCFKYELLSIV